jgi:hypothetical protein
MISQQLLRYHVNTQSTEQLRARERYEQGPGLSTELREAKTHWIDIALPKD